ncbi:cation:proton antiporter [Microbacterium telephonicum]|uniref:Sodium/proton antiporter (CPA1 family) n=1 Tax=Microbacterium telephonicum TaxID=1714841 RepID=A0A498CA48_9MICO|nr:sodium:proton antiporter [Microbacterium telephonicum]RLK52383.1 sodium/proton antiporter (CPA1 family) [Microbacterium telephonicum]
MEAIPILVAGIAVITLSTMLARRLGVAGPLILVGVGLVVSLFIPPVKIEPDLILVGILPPLLYAAAVRLPAVEFRRDGLPIAGLAVLLVVVSSLVLGGLFVLMIPGITFPIAVALGAILSPTDAVATSIIKRLRISPRVVTMLEGESLLNDATALVLLRSAVVAAAAGFSFWGTVGAFAWGVLAAVAIGAVVGVLFLRVRRWVKDPAANTALGFAIPFIAYLPTEHLGGSGLVAAVVAGIVTGQGSTRWLTPEQRISDRLNWRTVELILEGTVFLIMGLELRDVVVSNARAEAGGLWHPITIALAALGVVILVRAVYVSGLVALLARRARSSRRERLVAISERLDEMESSGDYARRRGGPRAGQLDPDEAARRLTGFRARVSRGLNDLNYYQGSPLGWKEGTVIVWAGMRGVVTLAAAQTIGADDTPLRDLIVLVAFFVALASLLLQGLTVPLVVKWLRIPAVVDDPAVAAERERLDDELNDAARALLDGPGLQRPDGTAFDPELLHKIGARMAEPPAESREFTADDMFALRIALIEAMRTRLDELSHEGSYSTAALRHALTRLDAEQLSLQLRVDDEDD